MDIPHFVQHPPSATELETARLLAQGKSVKEIAAIRHLAPTTIETHTKSLRYKFHCPSACGTVCIMIILGYLDTAQLLADLPATWLRYRKR